MSDEWYPEWRVILATWIVTHLVKPLLELSGRICYPVPLIYFRGIVEAMNGNKRTI